MGAALSALYMNDAGIVIVTERFDPHADVIIQRLRAMGINPMRFDVVDMLACGFALTPWGSESNGYIRSRLMKMELDEIRSVWWRRPSVPILSPEIPEKLRRHQRLQIEHAWQSIWLMCDCYWMSYPGLIIRAGWKPDQLLRAARFGFDTPDTLITTEAEEAADFASSHGGKVILKTFSDYGAIGVQLQRDRHDPRYHNQSTYKACYATLVSAEAIIANKDAISIAPCMFQEHIAKKYELRTTIIGDKVFTARIDSQNQERTRIDWRHYDVPMQVSAHELEAELIERCLSYVASYKLNFSAMDLVVTPDDRIVFLESNPNGQWMFVEQCLPQYPMTDQMCRCLIDRIPCSGKISYEEVNAVTA